MKVPEVEGGQHATKRLAYMKVPEVEGGQHATKRLA
jgi:hypothetical protein